MDLSEFLLKGTSGRVVVTAMSGLLFLGGPSTASPSLRPVEASYERGAGNPNRPATATRPEHSLAAAERGHLFGEQTDDASAKLRLHQVVTLQGTGDANRLPQPIPLKSTTGEQKPYPARVFGAADWQMAPQAEAVQWILDATGLSEVRVAELLDVKQRHTVRNWKAGKPIKEASMRRLVETRDILRRAQRWHPQRHDLVAWLHMPDADSGVSPATLLARGEFDKARFLAILAPARVEPTPAWAKRPVPAAWQESLEEPERPGEFVEDPI